MNADYRRTTKAPVVMIIFNRPDFTQRILDVVRFYEPSRLYVIADGPRSMEEIIRCEATRSIIGQVDWDCEVSTNYSEVNLGCNARIESGLDWVFDQCDEAIILEDDCLPNATFFDYCEELLGLYRDDERIMAINGSNFQLGQGRTTYSYYFSRYPHVWGWATWRRAWRYFDHKVSLWPTLRETHWLQDILGDRDATSYWRMAFDDVFGGQMTWDYRWTFACWAQSGLVIAPQVNLISNLGFGKGATHAVATNHPYANLPTQKLQLPLCHPPYVVRNRDADDFEFHQEIPTDPYHRLRRGVGVLIPMSTRHAIINIEQRLRARFHAL